MCEVCCTTRDSPTTGMWGRHVPADRTHHRRWTRRFTDDRCDEYSKGRPKGVDNMSKTTSLWGVALPLLAVLAASVLALTYLVCVGAQPADAAGPSRYDVTALDAQWTNSIARDINEPGRIAGQGQSPGGDPRAFLWEDGQMSDLGVPTGGNLSRARGINDSGEVVGEWRILVNRQQRFNAFLYEDGHMKDLNSLIPTGTGWDLVGAQAINETGQIVGSGTINGETHAFLYENGAPTDLGETLGDPYSAAWGLNDLGNVVGGAGSAENQVEAFVYRNGSVDRIGNPGPFSASEAVGINNSGKVIGWSFNPGQNPPQSQAFTYDKGPEEANIEVLKPLSGDLYSRARDIDEAGRVVGWSRNDTGVTQEEQFSAVLWTGGQAKNLNDLIPADSGWKLTDAYAINESGDIVGSGFKDGRLQAFLLTLVYDFSGFFSPVNNLPMTNVVNAGRAIPVKFSLSGDQGLDVFEEGYPRSQQVPCDAAVPVDGTEETVAAGASGLTYDTASDEYTYVWKTDKKWTGCRQLVVKLDDGTLHRANFSFTK